MAIAMYSFLDVSDGVKANQFGIGGRSQIDSLNDLDPVYRRLLDEPVTAVFSVIAADGRPSLTPMWFDYEGDKVLVNVAEHRKKTAWIQDNPEISLILMNPENPYHWVSMKVTKVNEIHEDDPNEGHRAKAHVDKIWQKYTGGDGEYGLRDPSRDERRILMECRVDKVSTFGQP
ncbi:MAG: PPOX class F420-dependent oxidoreductase [Acidimicrobiia bacterium]|nr:PPOX class F420-dependent oxidoreductase [Acidimicrobiia bacterium]